MRLGTGRGPRKLAFSAAQRLRMGSARGQPPEPKAGLIRFDSVWFTLVGFARLDYAALKCPRRFFLHTSYFILVLGQRLDSFSSASSIYLDLHAHNAGTYGPGPRRSDEIPARFVAPY